MELFLRRLLWEVVEDVGDRLGRPHPALLPGAASGTESRRLLSPLFAPDEILDASASAELQPRVYCQVNNGCCGYYALHSALLFARAALAPTLEECEEALAALRSGSLFWSFQRAVTAELLRHSAAVAAGEAETDDPQAWGRDLVLDGVLERPFLDHLLSSWPPLRGAPISYLGSLSDRAMRNSETTAEELEEAAALMHAFSEEGPSAARVFMFGAGNHWTAVGLNRVGAEHELLLFESYNTPLLSLSHEQLQHHIDGVMETHRAKWEDRLRTSPRTQHKVHLKFCVRRRFQLEPPLVMLGEPLNEETLAALCEFWMVDINEMFLTSSLLTRAFVRLLSSCVGEEAQDVRTLFIDALLDEVVTTWERDVVSSQEGAAAEERGLERWFEEAFHPSTLFSDVVEKVQVIGPQFASPQARERGRAWASAAAQVLGRVREHTSLHTRFAAAVMEVELLFRS